MTRLTGLSAHSNLADYEAGRRIPPRDVLDDLAKALLVDNHELSRLRDQALSQRAHQSAANPADQPAESPALDRHIAPETRADPAWYRRRAISRVGVGALSMFVLCGVWLVGRASAPEPAERQRAAQQSAERGNGSLSSCDADTAILDSRPLFAPEDTTAGTVTVQRGQQLGTVYLRFSTNCDLAWTKFVPSTEISSAGWSERLEVHRLADGAATGQTLQRVVAAESDPLLTLPGCVYATVIVTPSRHHAITTSTGCFGQ